MGRVRRGSRAFSPSAAPQWVMFRRYSAQGTTTPGQPNGQAGTGIARAVLNDVARIKNNEGNNVVVSVTNIAGTGPISYQWQKAPRGGGLHDIFYSIDYGTFANVVNDGRISGATSSALVIGNANIGDTADYLCVASNPYGSITSFVATVNVLSSNASVLVGQPAGDIITAFAADSTPVAESLDHVIDQAAQKWLSDGIQFGGACCSGPLPFVGPVGFVVKPVSGASYVNALRFFTANDSAGRDPYDYGLEGSIDGSSWTFITGGALKGTLSLPTGRNGTGTTPVDPLNQNVVEVNFANPNSYSYYRVTVTNNYNGRGDALMQVAEIQLIGTFVPAPPSWVRQPGDPDVANVTVFVGASPVFAAKATGVGALAPKYQWYKSLSTLISGATSSSYTFPNAQLSDSGTTFYCTASNSSSSTVITSTMGTLTVIAAPVQSYPSTILADNPIGYWRLDESNNGSGNNGVTAHDNRGGHNGYYSNSVNAVAGYSTFDSDTAADFGNFAPLNSYVANINDVDFARATNAPPAAFSVEAWVFGTSLQGTNSGIVSKGYGGILNVGTGTGTEQFSLDLGSGGPPTNYRFLVRNTAGQGYVAQSSVTPDTNLWHHMVGVCDQANGQLKLYIDGLLAATGPMGTGTNGGIESQPLAMTIGARQTSGGTIFDEEWVGHVDEVAVYNSALTANQASNHFFAAPRPPIITLQPVNTTTNESIAVKFTSSAYGPGTIGFQWYLADGTAPTTPFAGQNSSNLTFT